MKLTAFLMIASSALLACLTTARTPVGMIPITSPVSQLTDDETYQHHGQQLAVPKHVGFNSHIRGIMSNTCFSCHGPDEETNESGVRFDSFEAAVDESNSIEPGDAQGSAFYQRVLDADDPMPPADFLHQLTDYEKALFKRWIDDGAKYEKHWAYAPVIRPEVPELSDTKFPTDNPIDAFVFSRLRSRGLESSPVADRPTLLRRLSLDLVGLPPTPKQLAEFVADDSPQAYLKQVDRLLASPHFGERMSAFWLDIVRFSDTVGFHGDQNQRIFPYRDYVIDSLNRNQPFDEFTREQLAGDLLANPTDRQLTATGLMRLNLMTREGGAQPEEYLAKYTADRVRMLGTAWLGATTGCCECHNHKYDPFSIEDFYSLGAFFDDIQQWGVYTSYGYSVNEDLKGFNNNFPFPPELRHESETLMQQIDFLERRLDTVAQQQVDGSALQTQQFKDWLVGISAATPSDHWQPLHPVSVQVNQSQRFEVLDDHSVLFKGKPNSGGPVTIGFDFAQAIDIRGIRMEVLPDASHGGYVGRAADGRFRTTVEFRRQALGQDAKPRPGKARFVRVELNKRHALSLAEVQVYADVDGKLANVALAGTAKQSSTYKTFLAEYAIDGKTAGNVSANDKITHSNNSQPGWWEVDLGKAHTIKQVVVWNRTGSRTQNRLQGYQIKLLDQDRQVLFVNQPELPAPSTTIDIPAEFSIVDASDLPVSYAVANRNKPRRYSNGLAPAYLEPVWQSGPIRWQHPTDETKFPHVAVHALNKTFAAGPDNRLLVDLGTRDLGRVRFSVAPVVRPVAGKAAVNRGLAAAIKSLQAADNTNVQVNPAVRSHVLVTATVPMDRSAKAEQVWQRFNDLPSAAKASIKSAYYQHLTPFDKQDRDVTKLRDGIAKCRSGMAMSMISQSLPVDKRRQSRVLPRGDWQDKSGRQVSPNTPHFLPGHNTNHQRSLDRLDLAAWLTSADNPLTARHYVNRVWAQFFGTGLSSVIDDLGNQGEWPSHPLLMDWLASEFRSNWDRKKLIRLIVTSHTYRQRAAIRQDLGKVDPYNRLLGQQAARRLEAEIVRDNALSISGLLNDQWIGGPSVYPYQPAGYYSNLQFPSRRYSIDTDGRQYRRGVYMHWQRTFLHPMLANFDAPARDECVANRNQSNSPQQALTLLNDPVFVEAARAFAYRIAQQSTDSPDWPEIAFQIALSRRPQPAEQESLLRLYQTQHEYFGEHPDEAKAFLSVGQFAEQPELTPAEFAALGQLCRVILNLHETITRY